MPSKFCSRRSGEVDWESRGVKERSMRVLGGGGAASDGPRAAKIFENHKTANEHLEDDK